MGYRVLSASQLAATAPFLDSVLQGFWDITGMTNRHNGGDRN